MESRTKCIFLSVASFTEHNAFEIHPVSCVCSLLVLSTIPLMPSLLIHSLVEGNESLFKLWAIRNKICKLRIKPKLYVLILGSLSGVE